MTTAIAIIILIACGFLYYGWIRLRQEISAKITQLISGKRTARARGRWAEHTSSPRNQCLLTHSLRLRGRQSTSRPAKSPHGGGLPASSSGARTIPPVSFSNRRAA